MSGAAAGLDAGGVSAGQDGDGVRADREPRSGGGVRGADEDADGES